MNPFFYMLVIIGAVLLWFLLSFLFPLIGSLFKALWEDAIYNLKRDNMKDKGDFRS